MPRRRDRKDLERLYRAVEQHPGRRPSFFARLFGWPRSKVTRMLPDLDDHGYLLSEDERGRLFPFRRRRGR